MRRLLAVALVGSACSSAQPEVAAVPTPSPTLLSSAAPAASRPVIESREQYYDIDGSSAGALREQIHRLGPRDGGQARDALTVWTIDWSYRQAPLQSGCGLGNVQVTLTLHTTLPRWATSAGTPAGLVESWRSYLRNVKLHEAGHRAIAEQNARDLMAALLGLRAPTCQEVWDTASRTAERIVADGRARNRAYDVETKHGQTQGVALPR